MVFEDLKLYLNRECSELPARRVALLGDSATQFLAKAIRAFGCREKINFQLFEADFDQLNRQILDSGSELYGSNSEFIILYPCVERLWTRFAGVDSEAKALFADRILSEIRDWWQTIARFCQAKIIHLNFVEIDDGVFGNFGTKTTSSFVYQLRKINFELMNLARDQKHVFIGD